MEEVDAVALNPRPIDSVHVVFQSFWEQGVDGYLERMQKRIEGGAQEACRLEPSQFHRMKTLLLRQLAS